ncbi:MAG: alcohol dehydrogenase catalytic domain-containing protein [Methanocellales archaeon]|nr:alcohol dehydrogenase catalytic domain-containing protein [Methanocellales archaeon]MDD3291862.1 alcohol dehydrogenase catalytic domain-containing protein [Methanocellales archaeon]MDD5235505.1 alcohol dehydrogenase catalytic domain-containing protein [Methanocellales archaeon]MDD5485124.1 alcohol dehydrogenase catalytic domain-containing protein [Methanocellales archaeon]
MKAAVYVGNGKIEIEDIPIPEINNDEVLLKAKTVGLCKTDVKKVVYNLLDPPRIFGHEIVGEIAKVGENVWRNGEKKFEVGDRVLVFHHVPCLECFYCLNEKYSQCETYGEIDTTAGYGKPSGGGFAEYTKIPNLVARRGLIKIPDDVKYEEAVFVEPLNCCFKAIKRANISEKDTVLILGQGSIGLTLTQLCKIEKATVIATDLVDFKLNLSKNFGADYTIYTEDPSFVEKIRKFNNGRDANKCLVAVESLSAVKQGLDAIDRGGDIIFVFDKIKDKEVVIDPNLVSNKEIDIIGSYSSDYSLHDKSAELIFSRKINVKDMITHTFNLEEINKAIEMAFNPLRSIKILIKIS